MIRIVLQGCCGRMGRMITEKAAQFPELAIVAGVDAVGAADLPYPVYPSAAEVKEEADLAIDFSRPQGLPALVETAMQRRWGLLIAVTGLSEADTALLADAALTVPVLQATNFSMGVHVMRHLVSAAAAEFGEDADIEITETHHNGKADAPSGTALTLAEDIRSSLARESELSYDRHGKSCLRRKEEIGMHALRGGTVAGIHEVSFFGTDEILTVKHEAAGRQIFAIGALKAARVLAGKAPSMYTLDTLYAQNGLPEQAFRVVAPYTEAAWAKLSSCAPLWSRVNGGFMEVLLTRPPEGYDGSAAQIMLRSDSITSDAVMMMCDGKPVYYTAR